MLKNFAEGAGITFPLLSDADSEVIKAYGLHHQDGYPHPATVLIDKQGTVKAKLARAGYIQRHPADELVDAAAELE